MRKCILIAILLAVFPITSANATTIPYEASDLGAGLWQFDYHVNDFYFNVNYSFQILFEYGLYENITPVSASIDWDIVAFEPDSILGEGVYDALALIDGASLSQPFSVQFDWLGPGNPNGQDFEVYDPFYVLLDSGQTTPVPEPATLLLLGAGLAGLGIRKRINNKNT